MIRALERARYVNTMDWLYRWETLELNHIDANPGIHQRLPVGQEAIGHRLAAENRRPQAAGRRDRPLVERGA